MDDNTNPFVIFINKILMPLWGNILGKIFLGASIIIIVIWHYGITEDAKNIILKPILNYFFSEEITYKSFDNLKEDVNLKLYDKKHPEGILVQIGYRWKNKGYWEKQIIFFGATNPESINENERKLIIDYFNNKSYRPTVAGYYDDQFWSPKIIRKIENRDNNNILNETREIDGKKRQYPRWEDFSK